MVDAFLLKQETIVGTLGIARFKSTSDLCMRQHDSHREELPGSWNTLNSAILMIYNDDGKF